MSQDVNSLCINIYFRESILNFCGIHSARMCSQLHLYDEYARKNDKMRTVEMGHLEHPRVHFFSCWSHALGQTIANTFFFTFLAWSQDVLHVIRFAWINEERYRCISHQNIHFQKLFITQNLRNVFPGSPTGRKKNWNYHCSLCCCIRHNWALVQRSVGKNIQFYKLIFRTHP